MDAGRRAAGPTEAMVKHQFAILGTTPITLQQVWLFEGTYDEACEKSKEIEIFAQL
jgi:hypothetical protein